MEIKPTEPGKQTRETNQNTAKPARRRPRKRKTKRKNPDQANGDAPVEADAKPDAAPQPQIEVAAKIPPVVVANEAASNNVAEPSPEDAPPAKTARRSRRRRRVKRTSPPPENAGDVETTSHTENADEKAPENPKETPVEAKETNRDRNKGAEGQVSAAEATELPEGARKPRRRRRSTKKTKKASTQTEAVAKSPATNESTVDRGKEKASPAATDARGPSAEHKQANAKPAARVTHKTQQTGREMIINVSAGEECRVAILHEGRLEELHIERQSAESHVGNIYKGRITNVEPSIQAAFIDFGLVKNGFLHISDVQPKYFPDGRNELENVGKKVPRRDRPPIHKCFHRGQEVIVQITKEGVGTKGPTLTTYLSIPGRYLVMMPGMNRLGVSRKIEDEEERRKMRDVLSELSLPEEMGFILRTAGLDQTKRDLQRDLNYLKRLWKIVENRIRQTKAPAELYQESDLVIRTIRDLSTSDFDRIVIDHEPTAQKAHEFMQIAMPRSRNVIERYDGREPVFHKYGIEEEIERINSRHVPLRSGGSIVIESTEAMVAIDVNSGKFRLLDDAEETAFQINIEAAEEIARQLRLRDLGGLVICDFIDMRLDRHKRAVERTLREALKSHKERARILRMSQFGLIEMTRQRQRPSIKRSIYDDCPHCGGTGVTKTLETMVLEALRVLQLATHKPEVAQVALTVSPEVAATVLNQRRAVLNKLEQETNTHIVIKSDHAYGVDHLTQELRDTRGRIIGAARA